MLQASLSIQASRRKERKGEKSVKREGVNPHCTEEKGHAPLSCGSRKISYGRWCGGKMKKRKKRGTKKKKKKKKKGRDK